MLQPSCVRSNLQLVSPFSYLLFVFFITREWYGNLCCYILGKWHIHLFIYLVILSFSSCISNSFMMRSFLLCPVLLYPTLEITVSKYVFMYFMILFIQPSYINHSWNFYVNSGKNRKKHVTKMYFISIDLNFTSCLHSF